METGSAESDSEVLAKGMQWRIRVVLTVALSLIAYGFVYSDVQMAARWMLLIGLMLLPCVFWLRSQRIELAKQGLSPQKTPAIKIVEGSSPKKDSLVWIVISRGFLATCLAAVPDPMMIFLLGTLAGVALLMAVMGKPTDARVRLVKAAIYGVAAMIVYIHVADNQNQVGVLAGKLEEYKRQHGEYPEKLDALVPALLPVIQKPGLGPLLYTRKPDSSSYSLYYRTSVYRRCSYTPELKLKCYVD